MSSTRGTIKSWMNKSRDVLNQDQQLAYEEFLNYTKGTNFDSWDKYNDSEIANFYQDQSVFITGGSGFVGKCIIEKLLRSCPNIREIFILIRPKRGVDIETRLKLMLHLSLFDRIRSMKNGSNLLFSKIKPIRGDMKFARLGICEDDINYLSSRVNIIINSAASVRFNEPIEDSTVLNVIALDNLLNIALKMVKLRALVHISTCYAHCDRYLVEERFYESPIDPDELMATVRSSHKPVNSQKLRVMLAKTKRPNSYTLTKAVGESLILKRSSELLPHVAICIIRPSIVCATWREPLRGWVDNQLAATGLLHGLASGSTSLFYCKGQCGADIIPVDMVVNTIICSAWAICTYPDRFPGVNIFNASSGKFNRVDWRRIADEFNSLAIQYPYDTSVRPPGSTFVSNDILYNIIAPIDSMGAAKNQLICDILGFETTLWRLHKIALHRYQTLGYFLIQEWQFDCTKTRSLWDIMSRNDRELFHFSPSDINWKHYFRSYYVGTKIFVVKDNPDKLFASKRRMKTILWVRKTLSCMMLTVVTILLTTIIYRNSKAN